MISEHLLCCNLVAICNGDIVHLVTESDDKHILSVGNGCRYSCPYGNMLLGLALFPISDNDLAGFAKTCADMSELSVAMCALVQVHEIHVHGVPRYLLVVLCVEM